jgi:hypothetical protein
MFTVNGEFLGLHSWHSGNGYLMLSQDSSRIAYRQYWQMLSPAQPGHKNRPHLWLVGQIKDETMSVLWLCYDYMSINFDIRTQFWYLSQSHPSSLSLGLWDQWIYCHSRIKNNEDKCYGQTNENIHVHRLQRQHANMLTHYPEVDKMSKSMKNEPRNSYWANQSNKYLA